MTCTTLKQKVNEFGDRIEKLEKELAAKDETIKIL
jgi:SMC interacting uncharacterized protein involved in chromosome segregation